jgi:hypothetical protein
MFKKYVSRPVIKEAVQLTHENLEEVAEAIRAAGWEGCFAPPDRIHIPSWEGMITAFPGDWIIKATEMSSIGARRIFLQKHTMGSLPNVHFRPRSYIARP